MRTWLACAVSLAMVIAMLRAAQCEERSPGTKHYLVTLRMCAGNPRGNAAQGTMSVLESFTVRVRENEPSQVFQGRNTLIAGESVPSGLTVNVLAQPLENGRVRTKFTFELSNAAFPKLREVEGEMATIDIQKFCGVVALTPGTIATIHGKGADNRQIWLELLVTESQTTES